MHPKYLLIFIVVINCFVLQAQKEANIWYFGNKAGINFNNGIPVALTNGAMYQNEGAASIANENGDLLFYTDGISIWDSTHNVMPNGTGLLGNWSSTQSAIIIPWPEAKDSLIVFTVDAGGGSNGFRYSVVDMNLNGGLGDVISGSKNTLLFTPSTEKVTAARHANGNDIWVISHEWNNNTFAAYLVSAASGINSVPVKTNVGSVHTGVDVKAQGYMKISPNGNRLALAIQGGDLVEIFDFDPWTGIVTNPITITTIFVPYGLEFSPDGSRLYISSIASASSILYQFDLLAGTPSDVIASQTTISTNYGVTALQIAPDFKIYANILGGTTLGVINDPNQLGLACNYNNSGFSLTSGNCYLGLPNFMQSYFGQALINFQFDCFGDTVYFGGSALDSVYKWQWNFGDTASSSMDTAFIQNPKHYYADSGTYLVKLIVDYGGGNYDTITTELLYYENRKIDFMANEICEGVSTDFSEIMNCDPIWWQWDFGDGTTKDTLSNPSHLYSLAGTYSVRLSALWANGYTDTIVKNVIVNPLPNPNAGADQAITIGNSTSLNGTGGGQYFWEPPTDLSCVNCSDPVADPSETTLYILTIIDFNSCSSKDSMLLTIVEEEPCDLNVEMPNAFSPNGDERNEVIAVISNASEQEILLRIYNRFGNKIFETNDINQGWDGKLNGKIQAAGNYTYYLIVECEEGQKEMIKGNILLIR